MNTTVRKVGRITVAVGLVALGAALLMDNLLAVGPSYTSLILRFWPVVLIGFGLEYLLFSVLDQIENGQPVRLRFDIGGAILLFLLVGLTAGFHTVNRWLPNLGGRVFVGSVSAGTDRTETDSVSAEGVKEVVIEVDLGRVELYSQGLTEVRVEAAYGAHGVLVLRDGTDTLDNFDFDLERNGSTVELKARAPKGVNLGGASATYKVYLPSGLKVKVGTGAGTIQVRDYEGDLTLESKLGAIQVEDAAGKLDAETGSGSINIMNFSGPVVAKTMAGGISINQVNGPLQLDSGTGVINVHEYTGGKLVAETKTGSINVQTQAPLDGDVLLKTSAGSVNLTVPEESSMKVTAQTKTGSISAPDFVSLSRSGTSHSGVGSTGDGKHTVTLEATMGSINFHTR